VEQEREDEGPPKVLAVGPLQAVAPRSFILVGLFLLVLFHTLLVARDLFLPLMLAFFLSFLLSPFLRMLKRAHIPEAVGAALLLIVLVGGVGVGLYSLITPATEWIAKAPESMSRVQRKLRALRAPMQQMSRTADEVERTIAGDSTTAPVAAVKSPAWIKQAFFGGHHRLRERGHRGDRAPLFPAGLGGPLPAQAHQGAPHVQGQEAGGRDRPRDGAQHLHLPLHGDAHQRGGGSGRGGGGLAPEDANPVLWGVLACVLTYIPYLGAVVGIGILGLAALLVFDDLGHALAVPAVYLVVSFLEGNFVTPLVLGRRLTLNPVVIFVGLLFWFFLWGIPGALLAVPTLAIFKIVCDYVDTLAPIGEFFGPADDG